MLSTYKTQLKSEGPTREVQQEAFPLLDKGGLNAKFALLGGEVVVYRTQVTSGRELMSKILIRSEPFAEGKKNKQLRFFPVCW